MSKGKKICLVEDWRSYKVPGGESIDLPPSMIELLYNLERKPAPRETFSYLEGNLQAGDYIEIPFMGQYPEHFVSYGSNSRFIITEQMLKIWKEIKEGPTGQGDHIYRRYLSGPTGIGKSQIVFFLAAMGPLAERAHLTISKVSTPPEGHDIAERIIRNQHSLRDLVSAIFTQFLEGRIFRLLVTNLVNEMRPAIEFEGSSYKDSSTSVIRRFDILDGRFRFLYGQKLIQVSMNDFETHDNQDGMRISEVFERNADGKSKLEIWLDIEFGEGHIANLDPKSRKFIVTKDLFREPAQSYYNVYVRNYSFALTILASKKQNVANNAWI
ncbi:hypothetical protein BGZ46_010708 [Entomortierella lignicola]|nr:hypothetical protein BGZ46_010708 [Entomortierella lignicola]